MALARKANSGDVSWQKVKGARNPWRVKLDYQTEVDGVEGWIGTIISGPDVSIGNQTFIANEDIDLVKSGYGPTEWK